MYRKKLSAHTNAKSLTRKYFRLENPMSENNFTSLPKAALDEIPVPGPDAVSITGLVKTSGRISGYQLSDERIVSREEGVNLAKAGKIKGVGVAHNKDTEYLKAIPDGTEDNNLSSLPTVKTSAF